MGSSWSRCSPRSPAGSGRVRLLVLELSTISELLFASKCLRLHPGDMVIVLSREANVSLITPLIGYARIRHLLPTLLHPPRSLDSVQPEPAAATGGPSPPPARGHLDERPHGARRLPCPARGPGWRPVPGPLPTVGPRVCGRP